MSAIVELLGEMRGRLGMYLGTSSLIRLGAFLRGYEHGLSREGKADRFLADFRDWIHQRFQSTRHSWEETILLHSTDEADAVKRFWSLLDEYLAQQQEVMAGSETRQASR